VGVANQTFPFPFSYSPTAAGPGSKPGGDGGGGGEDNGSGGESFESTKTELVVRGKESTVISALRHFTSYQIEVHACNHPTDPARCSMAAYVSARTLPEGEREREEPPWAVHLVWSLPFEIIFIRLNY